MSTGERPTRVGLDDVRLRGFSDRVTVDRAADLVIATGRTATGPDDEAPLALAEAGELVLHGIALRPGGSSGMGIAGGLPVILLPGDPLPCLCAYDLFAGRFVRRLGGRDPGIPHPTCEAEVGRKILSAVGFVDVPAALEGLRAPGSRVTAHMY